MIGKNIFSDIKKNKTTVFYAVFFVIWVLLFYRCKFGCSNRDEDFFLSMSMRLVNGDAIIVDEWSLTSLTAYLLYPLMLLYINVFSTTDSIVLVFRYIYMFVWGVSAIFIFERLKKINFIGSAIASLIYLIYAPLNIMALTYNSFGIMFLTLSCVLFLTNDKNNRKISFLVGTLFSFSVLSHPTLILLFIVYTVYVLIRKESILNNWFYIFLGCFVQFIIFIFLYFQDVI